MQRSRSVIAVLAIGAAVTLLASCTGSSGVNGAGGDASGRGLGAAQGAVPAPVFSTDACENDADCVPATACHADRCMSRAKAGPSPSDVMCTMECRPGTVDCGYNHCGCAQSPSGQKLCAMLPGGAPN